jgi:hypothetical protein
LRLSIHGPEFAKHWKFRFENERGIAETMTDAVNFVMLVAASIGSMAFGVLAAYGVLRVGFALMRPRRQSVLVKAPAQEARV